MQYQYIAKKNGSGHVHTYADSSLVITGDSGIIKGCQSICLNGQILTEKTAPDAKEIVNGKSYDVYEYMNGAIFHRREEQALYVY